MCDTFFTDWSVEGFSAGTPVSLPLHSATSSRGGSTVLKNDNARQYRTRVFKDILKQHLVNPLDWPACTPDLNTVEHLWDVMDQRLGANRPLAVDFTQLYYSLQQE